jgi:hypothetical protein
MAKFASKTPESMYVEECMAVGRRVVSRDGDLVPKLLVQRNTDRWGYVLDKVIQADEAFASDHPLMLEGEAQALITVDDLAEPGITSRGEQ